MTIKFQVLGDIYQDNALHVKVETGQQVYNLLFDCGDGCLRQLSVSEIHDIEHLCFSHFHMDHVAGFDSFFRHNFAPERPLHAWGPQQTIDIMHHRFRGFIWNLIDNAKGTWLVHEVSDSKILQARFETSERFENANPEPEQSFDGVIFKNEHYQIHARIMDHQTPCLTYLVRENPRQHFHPERLADLGLSGGAWIANLKHESISDREELEIDDRKFIVGDLREKLLSEKPGTAIAYLTDFKLDDPSREKLLEMLTGCETIVCECQYSDEDNALAQANHHMTVSSGAQLAVDANAKKLILLHLSSRYTNEKANDILNRAREIFPETSYPDHWTLTEFEG